MFLIRKYIAAARTFFLLQPDQADGRATDAFSSNIVYFRLVHSDRNDSRDRWVAWKTSNDWKQASKDRNSSAYLRRIAGSDQCRHGKLMKTMIGLSDGQQISEPRPFISLPFVLLKESAFLDLLKKPCINKEIFVAFSYIAGIRLYFHMRSRRKVVLDIQHVSLLHANFRASFTKLMQPH